jgi:hypothetical protein
VFDPQKPHICGSWYTEIIRTFLFALFLLEGFWMGRIFNSLWGDWGVS